MKTIYVKISDNCNLNCSHCYIGERKNYLLNIKQFIIWLNNYLKCATNDIFEIVFHGGEPLLYAKDILNIIEQTNWCNRIKYNVTTNLAYEINDDILKVLNLCTIATSWDPIDIRFKNTKILHLWEDNCKNIKQEVNCVE